MRTIYAVALRAGVRTGGKYIAALVAGAVFILVVYLIPTPKWSAVAASVYNYVGPVLLGLLPMGILLIWAITMQVGHHLGAWHMAESHLRKYEIVEFASPALGLLGTMLGLSKAVNIPAGIGLQASIEHMTLGAGQAIGSSVVGLILALCAALAKHFYR